MCKVRKRRFIKIIMIIYNEIENINFILLCLLILFEERERERD